MRRATAAAAAAVPEADDGNCSIIEQHLYDCKALQCPPDTHRQLQTQWTKVMRRLQKAAEVRTWHI
jgi:hypothetical protein